jgi:hypothetical protein
MSRGSKPFRAPTFPWPARLGLGTWQLATMLGLPIPRFREEKLIAAARRRTGLHDFGRDEFRDPLRHLLRSLRKEAGLHLLGAAVMRSSIVRALECRLRLEALENRYPEIRGIAVEAPVFITGMQRTGTTKLHRLLSRAPELRSLSAAEALNPAPLGRLERADPKGIDLRLAQARRAEWGMKYLSPALFAIHPIEAEAPEEDVFLFDVTFVSPAIDASLDVPQYAKWMRETDQTPPYLYVRRLIQLLLWQEPGRYLGKTPHHQENLDVLLRVFPDAKVIATHRDPLKVVASFSSMMVHAGAMLAKNVDPKKVGRRIADQLVNSVERAMAAREQTPPGAILDIHYRDLLEDPLAEMQKIHAFADLEWNADSERRVEQWQRENPQHKYGTHCYELTDFGLDADELDARFKRYRERFDVPREDA